MSGRLPESPGLPEHIGSLPNAFAPGPFATRSIPSYPSRIQYAAFDPAYPPTYTTPGLQRLDDNRRPISAPPALETALFMLRERLPFPDRTMDEITDWMSSPIIEPRPYISEPIVEAERQAAGASDIPNDWDSWIDENRRRRTAWIGYDNSRYAIYGGRDIPNETAAMANDKVMQSIEPESDPLVALRRLAHDSQAVIRRELDSRISLEDSYRELSSRLLAAQRANINLLWSQQEAAATLASVQRERDQLRRERDLAQHQVAQVRPHLNNPELEHCRGLDQHSVYEEALERERDLLDRNQMLRQGETGLRGQLQDAVERETQLRTQLNRVDYQREQFEMERNHYWTERDREQELNRGLQAQIHSLSAQLTATQALANGQPPANQPSVAAAANTVAPVIEPPVAVSPAGSVHRGRSGRSGGGARSRAGRGRRRSAAVTRKQPGRVCKGQKSYKS